MIRLVMIMKGKVHGKTLIAKADKPFKAELIERSGDVAIKIAKQTKRNVSKNLKFFKITSQSI